MSSIENTMRQAVMVQPKTIVLERVAVPKVSGTKVLVETAYIGICGSDIHVYHGKHPYTSYPVVQGHEVSGKVVAIGDDVKHIKIGDHVTVEPQVSCGLCYPCTHGLYNICNNLKVMGFQTQGTASDYALIDEKHLVLLPKDIDLRFGAMIEPLAVAVRATAKAGDLKGKQVLVFGAGPIGNFVAQVAKAVGSSKVIICDTNELRLAKAIKSGIDVALNPKEIVLDEAIDTFFGPERRADVIFDCAGTSAAITDEINVARKGSTIVLVAVYGTCPPIDLARLGECELNLVGTARYNVDDFKKAIDLVANKAIKMDVLITDIFELPAYQQAYEKIEQSPEKTMKVLIRVQSENKRSELK
ncbi:MAG: alcohol dehydrogenase catalytic domain-containing protein [Sphaerochaetaceae bacterium]|nr:alcohol dehydrogenase catalytic domain-containing protein [Sphaerochaetaceae bacterium]MDD2405066.1 alcohol dehydrogenase catalytic domain-containing protein [Sphaerochaetaceae bacterium]MDD3669706.1 alcohol dehydrogenase catalytic domain-containing protein [Sphaerochaetaceae bacterium]MDD4258617.1 alcohol dehydrogenase catalytic domain-containing protein [Sphaerochaetaceae bacterium]MDD4764059.1 alcohol dehydrogenase catalytic domain-containing protein [Sphaerochaetaceae bacterium]